MSGRRTTVVVVSVIAVLALAAGAWYVVTETYATKLKVETNLALFGGSASDWKLFWYNAPEDEWLSSGAVLPASNRVDSYTSLSTVGDFTAATVRVLQSTGEVHLVVGSQSGVIETIATSPTTLAQVSVSTDGAYVAYTNATPGEEGMVHLYDRAEKITKEIGRGYVAFFIDDSHLVRFTPAGITQIDVVTGKEDMLYTHAFTSAPRVYQSSTRKQFVWVEDNRVTTAEIQNPQSLAIHGTFTGRSGAAYGIVAGALYELTVEKEMVRIQKRTMKGLPILPPFSAPAGELRDLANIRQP